MIWSLNTLFIKPTLIKEKIKSCENTRFKALELWIEEIENDPKEVKKMLNDCGLFVSSVEKLCGWFENDGELMGVKNNHLEIIKECERRIELCSMVGAKKIIACPAFSHRGHFSSMERGINHFLEIKEIGEKYGVEVTLEFMGQTKQINTLSKALSFYEKTKSRLVIDAYHLWKSNEGKRLKDIEKEKISLLHISDANKEILKEVHKDSDRVLPGEGCINLREFIFDAYQMNYDQEIALGVYNPKFWSLDPYEAVKLASKKCETLEREICY